MLQMTLYSLLTISSFTFMQMNHPLAMGLMLLIQTTLMSILTGIMSKTFWFSYILFLIFLGGMLVLFIYTTSLASNEMFTFSSKLLMTMIILFLISMMFFTLIDKTYLSNLCMNLEMNNINNMNSFLPENTTILYKLYNYPTNLTTIIIMNYLLITMIAVVKMTNLFFGPLRMLN